MIGSVRGTVLERTVAGEVLVEVGGVGYRCLVPLSALPAVAPGQPTFLMTHLHVREDAMTLYGFPSRDERDTFEVLIGANGVGPKLALAILSVHPPTALRHAVAEDDLDALCLVPGIGRRTAQKLMVELKSRLGAPDIDLGADDGVAPPARAEVRAALTELGYGADEIRAAVGGLPVDGAVEDLLREALRRLAVKASA
jgi:Holliday junction DNA helicase RuvA